MLRNRGAINSHRRPGRNLGQYQRNSSTAKQPSIAELEMLRFTMGAQSNLIPWTKKLSVYAVRTFKQLGFVVEQLEYWMPPPIEEPDPDEFNDVNDPHQFRRKAHQRRLHSRDSLIEEMHNNRPALYAVIWGHISVESEEQVKLQQTYEDINAEKDPLGLLILIRGVHVGGRFPNEVEARLSARRGYTALQQYSGESISHFKERFDSCLLIMDNAEYERPNEQDLAVDFIDKLDSARFGEFQKDIHNNVILGIRAYPESVQEGFISAGQYLSTARREAKQVGPTVFVANASNPRQNRGRGRGSSRGRSRQTGGRGRTGNDSASDHSPRPAPPLQEHNLKRP